MVIESELNDPVNSSELNRPEFDVPDPVSFEEAIALTQALLDNLEQGKVSELTLKQTVRDLVNSENGARGFFVTYLSDERAFIDECIPAVVEGLTASPEVVSPLLVKNLAMSTAMAITHRRNQQEAMAKGSDRVRSRTARLIQALSFPQLQEQAKQLTESIDTGAGHYQSFLERWGYDDEQKRGIYAALQQIGLAQDDGFNQLQD